MYAEGSAAPSVVTPQRESNMATADASGTAPDDSIRIVFSDVDGTLAHYPDNLDDLGEGILKLPASATGMQGIISSRTLVLCQELRRQQQKLVLISGMRTSTLLRRLPYLPRADAYCESAIVHSIETTFS